MINKNFRYRIAKNSGQALLLVVLVMSLTIIGATVIAGYLTQLQLRQATNVSNSQKAIFAADAGAQCIIHQINIAFDEDGNLRNLDVNQCKYPRLVLSNDASIVSVSVEPVDLSSLGRIKSIGEFKGLQRAICISFAAGYPCY